MSAAFTPGPWLAVDRREMNGAIWICAPDEMTSHAEVRAGCSESENIGGVNANAHLIAADPDLFAALDLLCRNMDELDQAGLLEEFDIAQAALAKARGESA